MRVVVDDDVVVVVVVVVCHGWIQDRETVDEKGLKMMQLLVFKVVVVSTCIVRCSQEMTVTVPEQKAATEVMKVIVAEAALLLLLLAVFLALPLLHHLTFRTVAQRPRQHFPFWQADIAQPQ